MTADINARPIFTIFVSSPGDVQEERVIAQQVIERLASRYVADVDLKAVFWEHEPLLADKSFQDNLPLPSATDLLVCILWSRIGTRLPSQFTPAPGMAPPTGTEYEIHEALRAFRNYSRPALMIYRKNATVMINANEAGSEEKLRQNRALGTLLESIFKDDDGALKMAHHQFDASHTFAQILETHLTKWLARKLPDARPQPTWTHGSPFRGLSVFEAEHAPIFKGRGRAIAELLQKAREHAAAGKAFTLVLGQSGSGKSSLLRAGVLPLLTQPGVIEGVGLWKQAIMTPDQNKGKLFESLSAALHQALPELGADGDTPTDHATLLADNPEGVRLLIKGGLSQAAFALQQKKHLERQPMARLVLLIDQFETLFTADGIDIATRNKFVAALSALAHAEQVWVFATLRSDFYHRLEEIPSLLKLKSGAEYQLAAPGASELAEIIRIPAQAAGLAFEKDSSTGRGLDDDLIDAAAHNLQNLPLLEFVLDELYRADQLLEPQSTNSLDEKHNHIRLLKFHEYKAIGGMEGAIANRAETVLCGATLQESSAFATVMRRLVSQRPGDPANRRLAPKTEFSGPAASLVERFTQSRLIIAGPDGVSLAHDALLTRWHKLADQIRADADFHLVRTRIAEAEERWRHAGRPADLLLRPGRELEESRDILEKYGDDLSRIESAYIEASMSHQSREQKRRERLLLIIVVVISLLGLTSTYGLLSSIEKNKELQSVIDVKKESTAAIQAKIQSFLARYHKPEELLILLHKYGTGHQMYASEECKDLREIGGYFEQLGTDVRFKYIKFNYVFEIVDFPDDFWNLTAEIRREFRENNWSENGKGLPDFWSNFEYLKQRYENEYLLNRHSKTKRLKNQLDTLLDNRQNTKLEPLHNLKLNE